MDCFILNKISLFNHIVLKYQNCKTSVLVNFSEGKCLKLISKECIVFVRSTLLLQKSLLLIALCLHVIQTKVFVLLKGPGVLLSCHLWVWVRRIDVLQTNMRQIHWQYINEQGQEMKMWFMKNDKFIQWEETSCLNLKGIVLDLGNEALYILPPRQMWIPYLSSMKTVSN